MKFMLDSMVYDKIVATPQMVDRLNQLSKDGKVVVLCTHIQQDELACISDKQKREAVAKIIRKHVPTSGGVYDVSKWDQFTWGDGSSGGFGIDDVRSDSKKHTNDALIATTAARDADVLVTEERRLANRMKALHSSCKVWAFDRLKEYIFGQL
ncbi:MAG TPA: hypothetical protein VMW72_20295 [Sedimentisphaerales bacterium]|nr:hypothetical protein [Sedimentisphaerales bacterium]